MVHLTRTIAALGVLALVATGCTAATPPPAKPAEAPTSQTSHPVTVDNCGLPVVFDTPERVFEVSIEQLIARDPDVLILLYQGSASGVRDEVANLPGSNALRALKQNQVMEQLFNFTEPPTPLSVTGLERIVERFGTTP